MSRKRSCSGCSVWRKRSPAIPAFMRILIVKLSSLGDLFHALPVAACLRRNWNTQIDWVTNAAYAGLVSKFAPVDRVIPFPRRNFLRHASSFLRELRQEPYDFIFDMQGLLKSALVTRVARGEKRIGPSFHREGSIFFYHAVTGPRDKQRHAIEENYDLIRFLGLNADAPSFPVQWEIPAAYPEGKPRVAIIPRSRWITKNWPAASFAEVARSLASRAHLFVFGAPGDEPVCEDITRAAGPAATNMCGRTSLLSLGGWMSVMDLVITVDSGPMHVAAAAGAPVLAIFGATEAARTGPYGSRHRILARRDLACRPCLSRTCQLPGRDIRCLTGLAPDTVIEAAMDMLKLDAAV